MNLLEIEAGLINKSITLDSKGHRTNSVLSHLSQYIKDKTDWIKQLETGSYIGHDKEVWTKEHNIIEKFGAALIGLIVSKYSYEYDNLGDVLFYGGLIFFILFLIAV